MVQKPKNRFRKKTVFDMSGLSIKDVFSNFYGSFEPAKPKFFHKSVINTNLYPILFNFCLKGQENTTKLHIYSLN